MRTTFKKLTNSGRDSTLKNFQQITALVRNACALLATIKLTKKFKPLSNLAEAFSVQKNWRINRLKFIRIV